MEVADGHHEVALLQAEDHPDADGEFIVVVVVQGVVDCCGEDLGRALVEVLEEDVEECEALVVFGCVANAGRVWGGGY